MKALSAGGLARQALHIERPLRWGAQGTHWLFPLKEGLGRDVGFLALLVQGLTTFRLTLRAPTPEPPSWRKQSMPPFPPSSLASPPNVFA